MAKTYYLPSHEYITVEGDEGRVGISEYAASQLGAVTYVDMPAEGDTFDAGEDFGAIESRKAASDLYMPVAGEVIAVNEDLENDPRLINNDPAKAWIVKIRISDPSELDKLMDADAYRMYLTTLH